MDHHLSSADGETLLVAPPGFTHGGSRILSANAAACIHAHPIQHPNDVTHRVLVLSNDTSLREAICGILPARPTNGVGGIHTPGFQVNATLTGTEALREAESALTEGAPYALALLPMDPQPDPDALVLARRLWKQQPGLQIIFYGANTAPAKEHLCHALGASDNYLLLRLPLDALEARQTVQAMTQKWLNAEQVRRQAKQMAKAVASQTARLTAANEQLRAEIRLRGKIEMELRGSEHRFQLAFKAAAIPMAIMHTASRTFLEVNHSFASLAARTRTEIVGRTAMELGMVVSEQDYDFLIQSALCGGRVRDFASHFQPRTGEARDILLSLEPVVLAEEACVLVAMLDVTEQRKLEQQLRQSQKMDAVGQLAAGVAHDFNNLLTIIHGHVSLQLGRTKEDEPMQHSLLQVKTAADRAATLTRQLLTFSRKQVMQYRPLCLNTAIEQTQAMLRRLLGETIQLECRCQAALPLVIADANSIDQVIMNLAVNARDAMPGGGHLHISTQRIHFTPEDLKNHPDARAGKFACLTVADSGCGMEPQTLTRIFEPFFTTKPAGKGTGLGLSTVYGIVKQHNGWLEVESTPALGTKFHIYLELTDQVAESPGEDPPAPKTAPASQGGQTILVVEDEPVLREFVTEVLAAQGYFILQAGDGVEALKVANDGAARIDLLLTDMVMPNGVNGNQLAKRLLAKRQQMKVLFTSGYSQELMDNAERLVDGHNFLPKPFDVNRLLRTVQTCLENQSLPLATEDAFGAATN